MEQRRCLRIGGPGRELRRARPARTVQVAVVPAGAGALCLAGPESVYIPMPSTRSIPALAVLAVSMFALSSCSAAGSLLHRSSKKMPETDESFSVSNNYSQTFDVSAAWACEAARRALLSQAYVVAHADADSVEAAKNFQPTVDVHEQVQVHVSCVSKDDGHAWMFVSALQDRYALKKSNTNASVGVSALGSLSLPIGSTDDSLVKVASQTVQSASFYGQFFKLVEHYLPATSPGKPLPPAPNVPAAQAPAQPQAATLPQVIMVPAYSVAPGGASPYMLSPAVPGAMPYAAPAPVTAAPAAAGTAPAPAPASSLLDPPAMPVETPAAADPKRQQD